MAKAGLCPIGPPRVTSKSLHTPHPSLFPVCRCASVGYNSHRAPAVRPGNSGRTRGISEMLTWGKTAVVRRTKQGHWLTKLRSLRVELMSLCPLSPCLPLSLPKESPTSPPALLLPPCPRPVNEAWGWPCLGHIPPLGQRLLLWFRYRDWTGLERGPSLVFWDGTDSSIRSARGGREMAPQGRSAGRNGVTHVHSDVRWARCGTGHKANIWGITVTVIVSAQEMVASFNNYLLHIVIAYVLTELLL